MLVIDSSTGSEQMDEEKVKKTVARFLPFHEVPYRSTFEKWADGLQKHFPLENTHVCARSTMDNAQDCGS